MIELSDLFHKEHFDINYLLANDVFHFLAQLFYRRVAAAMAGQGASL